MNKFRFWIAFLFGLALVLGDGQVALPQKPRRKRVRFGDGRAGLPIAPNNWAVTLHLTDLSQTDANDYLGLLLSLILGLLAIAGTSGPLAGLLLKLAGGG